MDYVLISQVEEMDGKVVQLNGWIQNFRSSGKIMFLELRDGSGFIQVIVNQGEVSENIWTDCQKLTQESSVRIKGTVTKHPKKEEYEIQLLHLDILNLSQEYPITKKEHGPDFLLDKRHLWLRSKSQWALLRLRSRVFLAITRFMENENCIRVDTPVFTPTSCEDTSELFEVDYFGEPAYLTQSGQLYLEAIEHSVGRCYDFSPAFRAEKSKTRRHLTEFWMMDVELPFEDQAKNEEFQENMVSYVIKDVLENCSKELQILDRDFSVLQKIKPPFPRISHKEAIDILKKEGIRKEYTDDLTGAEETLISSKFDKPVIIKEYPFNVKAFYMKQKRGDDGILRAVCNDMLFPQGYGEIIGGAQREENYDILLRVMKEKSYKIEDYSWYLDLRKYGSIVHSGFGIGLERLVLFISGRKHIRETIAFPRLMSRLKP